MATWLAAGSPGAKETQRLTALRADSEDGDLCSPLSLGSALATLALWWNPVSGHLLTSCCLFWARELCAGGRQARPSCVRAPAHLPHPLGSISLVLGGPDLLWYGVLTMCGAWRDPMDTGHAGVRVF